MCKKLSVAESSNSVSEQYNTIKKSDFYNIYDKILKPSCGISTCHDGSFEPNYSSISSSYYTMVWHPILKNNKENTFKYRVIPYNVDESLFYERVSNCCFVDDNDRMPFYDSNGLSESEKDLIKKWISEGAKDIFGQVPHHIQDIINIDEMNIYYWDKKGILKNDFEYLYNVHNEKYTISIPSQIDSITIKIQLAQNNIHQLSLSLYSDFDYSKKITDINPVNVSNENVQFTIHKKEIANQEMVFFRVNISELPYYTYPNNQISSTFRYNWSFSWK